MAREQFQQLEYDAENGGTLTSYFDDTHAAADRFYFVLANPPFNVNAVDKGRLQRIVGPSRRFRLGLLSNGNATATNASANASPAKPDPRSVGGSEPPFPLDSTFPCRAQPLHRLEN